MIIGLIIIIVLLRVLSLYFSFGKTLCRITEKFVVLVAIILLVYTVIQYFGWKEIETNEWKTINEIQRR